MIHKRLCGIKNKFVDIPCKETVVNWDKFYQKMPIYSISDADFEARSEPIFDKDKQHCKTIDVCKRIACCIGFYVVNKLNVLPIEMG